MKPTLAKPIVTQMQYDHIRGNYGYGQSNPTNNRATNESLHIIKQELDDLVSKSPDVDNQYVIFDSEAGTGHITYFISEYKNIDHYNSKKLVESVVQYLKNNYDQTHCGHIQVSELRCLLATLPVDVTKTCLATLPVDVAKTNVNEHEKNESVSTRSRLLNYFKKLLNYSVYIIFVPCHLKVNMTMDLLRL